MISENKKAYMREYKKKNRARLNEYKRLWALRKRRKYKEIFGYTSKNRVNGARQMSYRTITDEEIQAEIDAYFREIGLL